ncbi:MAG: SDR family NAD(P)-dependent oxidoreductase [Geminicoccaceae bacterium]
MLDDLRGKVVLVTGASTGIGAAVAQGFGRCGARVAVHYRRSEAEAEAVAAAVREAGGEAVVVQGDVTRKADLERIIDRTLAAFGRLDVLINNAGDVVERKPFDEADDAFIDHVIDLNARAVVTACQLAVRQFKKQGGGVIINTTSLAARQAGGPGSAIYGSSKAFAQGLTRYLARDHARDNIRVNAVAPGFVMTPLQERTTSPEQRQAMAARIPMGRGGLPEDLVGAYLFLASDAMSGWITGATIDVNGGAYFG